jgi:LPXTG-motif cell wall-anchored protein
LAEAMATRPFPAGAVLLALVALALLLHAPVLGLSFFSDDFSVLHRIGVQGDLGTGSFFRPLPDWTLYVNYLLAGPTPWAFRIVNVVLLGINGWLVYMLGRRLLPDGGNARWSTALIAAVLFVCYPFHNEPQLWIIGRSTAMATMFTLLALVVATSHASMINKCIMIGLCGALGALCYELSLLLPLLLAALALAAPKSERRTWVAMVLITSAVASSNLFLRSLFTGHVANEYGASFFSNSITSYLGVATKVFGRLFLPPNPNTGVQTLLIAALALALAVIAYFLLRRTKNDPANRNLLLALAVMIVVACGIGIIGGVSTRTSESDRFLYLPSAFLCLLLAFTVSALGKGKARISAIGVLTMLSLVAMRRNHVNWIEASRTIERIVEATPEPPANARLLVHGLPGDAQGAFIFRHGYREALEFNGRDASHIRVVPEGPNSIWEFLRTETGDTLHRNGNDRWFDASKAAGIASSVP